MDKPTKFLLAWGEGNYRKMQRLNLSVSIFKVKNEKKETKNYSV